MTSSDSRFPDHSDSGHAPSPFLVSFRFPTLPQPARWPPRRQQISPLQITAWTVANLSYQAPADRSYRRYALDLYRRDTHERMMKLFLALDAQNAEIDAALAAAGLPRDSERAPSSPEARSGMSADIEPSMLLGGPALGPERHNAIVRWGPPAPPRAA